MAYGPRVVSKRAPIDPNDKSAFTINIPQGAKSIIKQAVEEYKQSNQMGSDEVERRILARARRIAPCSLPRDARPGSLRAGRFARPLSQ